MKWKGEQFSLESLTMQALATEDRGDPVVDGKVLEGGLHITLVQENSGTGPGNQLEVLEADGP